MGNAGQVNYSTAKAGLLGFTKSLAREIASRGITVNTIAPGVMGTPMLLAMPEKVQDALSANVQFPKRLGLPEEFGVRGSIFIDGGSLADIDDSGAGIVDIGSLRAATGFGISWDSPFGPIRIDFTETLLSESFDETETVNFRFGARL